VTAIGYSEQQETIIAGDSLGHVHLLRLVQPTLGPNRREAIVRPVTARS
jgi:hypothetical protein